MALKAVIVDDEPLAREELSFLLSGLGGVDVVAEAGNGVEALDAIEQTGPDLAFLDVQMPGLTGFDVARRLMVNHSPVQLVFVTAFDQYAIEAFEVNAVDYLLKPVDASRLQVSIDRVRRRRSSDQSQSDQVERLLQLMTERQTRPDRLAIKVGERLLLVHSDEVIFASLTDQVITVVTATITGTCNYRTLDELHAHLDPAQFWRVHRSHLVNINKIKEIVPWFSRNYILKMKDAKATEIPVSRTQTKRLRDYLRI